MRARRPGSVLFTRPDSKYYWCYVYVDGRRRKVSTKRTDRKAAELEAVKLQREAADPRPRARTVSEELDWYIDLRTADWSERSLKNNVSRANALAPILGPVITANLRISHIEKYAALRLSNHKSSSVKQELSLLFAVLCSLKKRGEWAGEISQLQPAIRSDDLEPKTRWLSLGEVKALTAKLRDDRADWVWVACYTGCRKEEVNGIEWSHIDIEGKVLRIEGTKNQRSKRTIPMAASLIKLLRRRKRAGLSAVVPWHEPSRELTDGCAKALIPRCTAHDFRRTFASWLLQLGVSERAIADLLGHSGIKLVQTVYAHLGPQHLRAAIEKLP